MAAAVPHVAVADCKRNTQEIMSMLARAEGMGAEVIVLPELCITAYTCQDLFQQQVLIQEAEASLLKLLEFTHNLNIIALVGVPMVHDGMLFNCAAVISHGKMHGLVPKTYLPNYKEFNEQRWFAPADRLPQGSVLKFCGQNVPIGAGMVFCTPHFNFGIEICEDLWAVIPPSSQLALGGADIIFNLPASNELIGKTEYLNNLVRNQSARCISGYVYAGCGFGESTQDLVFSGRACIAENGHMLAESTRFAMDEQLVVSEIDVERLRLERMVNTSFTDAKQNVPTPVCIELPDAAVDPERFTLTRTVDAMPFVPTGRKLDERCEEILCIQSEGLAKRIQHTGAQTVVVGISGGLDSTLALLVCVHAFDRLNLNRRGIVGITMPGFGTTDRTYQNALTLMRELGITTREISIRKACEQHFADIGLDANERGAAYENAQARERTQILMDLANKENGIVIGTGDLSEAALGWATYNGDSMSMYNVNCSIPKTLVRKLVEWAAENDTNAQVRATLKDIVDTPVSPELLPADNEGNIAQKTEDLVGPYALHDFFIYNFLRNGFSPAKIEYLACRAFREEFSKEEINHWLRVFLRRFFSQQFKRSAAPDGPKVGSISLSPRGDLRMPSDASVAEWLK